MHFFIIFFVSLFWLHHKPIGLGFFYIGNDRQGRIV